MTQIAERPETVASRPADPAQSLQKTLVELIELSMQAKQAHWNVVGTSFKPLHEFLDELADQYRAWYDDIAERLTAIGVSPDGRCAAVVSAHSFDPLPPGSIEDTKVVRLFEERVSTIGLRVRERAASVGEADLASQDLLVEILRGLDKQRWMLRAHRPDRNH